MLASYIWCIVFARWHTAPELISSPSKLMTSLSLRLFTPFHVDVPNPPQHPYPNSSSLNHLNISCVLQSISPFCYHWLQVQPGPSYSRTMLVALPSFLAGHVRVAKPTALK